MYARVFLTNFPLYCTVKLQAVNPFTCRVFKLILKAEIGYLLSGQQHQIVLLFKPYETEFFNHVRLIDAARLLDILQYSLSSFINHHLRKI